MNAFEFAIARKIHQLRVQPPPLSKEDVSLLATCEWAVNGFTFWHALHDADAQRVGLRRANGIRQRHYQIAGESG